MSIRDIERIFTDMLGVKFLGIQSNPGNDIILFNDLYSNTTLALYSTDLSQENIRQKVIDSRKAFQI